MKDYESPSYIRSTLLDMPYLRDAFIDPVSVTRSDIYHTRKNSEDSLKLSETQLNSLNTIGSNISDTSSLVSDLLAQNEKESEMMNSRMDNMSGYLGDNLKSINNGLGKGFGQIDNSLGRLENSFGKGIGNLQESIGQGIGRLEVGLGKGVGRIENSIGDGVGRLNSTLGTGFYDLQEIIKGVYGMGIPSNSNLKELGENLSIQGKKTFITLFVNGILPYEYISRFFSKAFLKSLQEGLSSEEARRIKLELLKKLEYINQDAIKIKNKNEKLENRSFMKTHAQNKIVQNNTSLKNLSNEEQNINTQLRNMMMSDFEINMLDLGINVRGKSLVELFEEGIIDRNIIKFLIRKGIINVELSEKIANIVYKNEKGEIVPFIELEGISGLNQNSRIQRTLTNVIALQGQEGINQRNVIIEQGRSFQSIGERVNTQLEESNKSLSGIEHGIHTTNSLVEEGNRCLSGIEHGIHTTNSQLVDANRSLSDIEQGIHYTNSQLEQSNRSLSGIEHGVNITNAQLEQSNRSLSGIEDGINFTNSQLSTGVNYLRSIDDQLYASTRSSAILRHEVRVGNSLQLMTNKLLFNIDDNLGNINASLLNIMGLNQDIANQIKETRFQIVNGLINIGNTMIAGFNGLFNGLDTLNNTSFNIQTELEKQSNILSTPRHTESEELFRSGLKLFSVKNFKIAFQEFQEGWNKSRSHFGNNLFLAQCYKILGFDNESLEFFSYANDLTDNTNLKSIITLEMSKIFIKNFKFEIGEKLLEDAIIHDSNNLEAFLLKTRLVLLRGEEMEANILLDTIYKKIFEKKLIIDDFSSYTDIIKLLEPKLNSYILENCKSTGVNKLTNLLKPLYTIGFSEHIKEIIENVILKDVMCIENTGFALKQFLENYPDFAIKLFTIIEEKIEKLKLRGGDEYDYLIYLGKGLIDNNILTKIKKIKSEKF